MKYLNGACNYRVNKKDENIYYETDKINKYLLENFTLCIGDKFGPNDPQRRAKWKASDTYWKDINIKDLLDE